MLRSAVGKTHVLRSRLVMDYTTSHLPLIVLGYPYGTCDFPPQGHVVIFGPITELV